MKHHEFQVSQGATLDIHLTAGSLRLRPGTPGVIEVDVETNDPNFEVEQRGNQIYISSDRESRWSSARKAAQVVVKVPEGTDASIALATASLDSSARLGDVFIKSATADIDVSGIRGGNVKTASGEVQIGEVEDYVKVASASGDITIGHCVSKGELSAASGDIHVRHCEGPLKANSASGDIIVSRFSGDRGNFKTMSGDVTVGVPSGTKVGLDVTTLSGDVILPKKAESETPPTRSTSITAKLVSGDLILKRVED